MRGAAGVSGPRKGDGRARVECVAMAAWHRIARARVFAHLFDEDADELRLKDVSEGDPVQKTQEGVERFQQQARLCGVGQHEHAQLEHERKLAAELVLQVLDLLRDHLFSGKVKDFLAVVGTAGAGRGSHKHTTPGRQRQPQRCRRLTAPRRAGPHLNSCRMRMLFSHSSSLVLLEPTKSPMNDGQLCGQSCFRICFR